MAKKITAEDVIDSKLSKAIDKLAAAANKFVEAQNNYTKVVEELAKP